MAKAKKLGKGLDEIFGENFSSVLNDINAPADGSQAVKISLDEIRPNPYQPRKTFDREALNDLAASIKEHGVFNPILVRKSVGGYELIAGERRLRASKIAGMRDIPSIVVEFDDTQMMEISILENIQREDLSPLEEARAYQQLIEKLGYTQEKLAERIGKSRPYITNILRLLKLPEEVQDMVNGNKLSYGHARALLALEDEGKMIELAKRAIKEDLSVRDMEKLVKEKPVKIRKEKESDPFIDNVRSIMENKHSTKTEIDSKRIVIHYNGTEDLNRILEIIGCLEE